MANFNRTRLPHAANGRRSGKTIAEGEARFGVSGPFRSPADNAAFTIRAEDGEADYLYTLQLAPSDVRKAHALLERYDAERGAPSLLVAANLAYKLLSDPELLTTPTVERAHLFREAVDALHAALENHGVSLDTGKWRPVS